MSIGPLAAAGEVVTDERTHGHTESQTIIMDTSHLDRLHIVMSKLTFPVMVNNHARQYQLGPLRLN